jgi:cupin 2 domain-containing protein
MTATTNIFAGMPATLDTEQITTLLTSSELRIERIVSHGHASPSGFWYDQPQAEWVIVLTGAARLRFEGDAADTPLAAGDYLHIAAHRRHRVAWTDPAQATVWLAVHHD